MSARLSEIHRVTGLVLVAAVLTGLAWMSGHSHEVRDTDTAAGTVVQNSRLLMGTQFNLSVWVPIERAPEAAEALLDTLDQIEALERQISDWDPNSEISAVNRAAGQQAVRVSPPVRELVATAIDWSRRTEGAFDITGGALFELWRRARQEKTLPSDQDIASVLPQVGYQQLELEGDNVKLKRAQMKIDVGAIGKGFAADRAAAYLRAHEFPDFVIDAGGDLAVSGRRGNQAWDVAVRHPRRDELLATCAVTDCAVATSGDYEQYVTVHGQRYSHIIDPRTGWPASDAVSVTVITSRATDADVLATALSVMGADKGIALANSLPDVEALIFKSDGSRALSDGLRLVDNRLEKVP